MQLAIYFHLKDHKFSPTTSYTCIVTYSSQTGQTGKWCLPHTYHSRQNQVCGCTAQQHASVSSTSNCTCNNGDNGQIGGWGMRTQYIANSGLMYSHTTPPTYTTHTRTHAHTRMSGCGLSLHTWVNLTTASSQPHAYIFAINCFVYDDATRYCRREWLLLYRLPVFDAQALMNHWTFLPRHKWLPTDVKDSTELLTASLKLVQQSLVEHNQIVYIIIPHKIRFILLVIERNCNPNG